MKLEPIDVANLDVRTGLPDLRRDIHVFVDYVRGRRVKRAHRDNCLSKADAKRLAKVMSDPDALEEVEQEGFSAWVGFVDRFVLQLGFVSYDTKGVYAGYTSAEPSFPDNFIDFLDKVYEDFIRLNAAKVESTILTRLLQQQQGRENEFFCPTLVSRLDHFGTRGSATGVIPLLDFPVARRFLLELLAQCPAGQWLSTASLIGYLKEHHRYFLIPQKPRFKNKWEATQDRYGNFRESTKPYGEEIAIAESDKDSFERVEGRYVERFLEGIPLLLRYVDVAYAPKSARTIYPSIGQLKAFRVSERLNRALRGDVAEPQVIVTPSFDVHVQGESYPVGVLSQLAPLCELISDDTSIVMKMTKLKVAAARAADPKLDVVALLRRLSVTEIPPNVVRELSDWSEHGEKLVLYPDCAVLEADQDLKSAAPFTIESIAPGISLVHSPDKFFNELERQQLMPLRVKHGKDRFSTIPGNARTRFPKRRIGEKKTPASKVPVTLMRVTRIQLVCPNREFLDRLHRVLIEANCPIEADVKKLVLCYTKTHESQVSDALRLLKQEYQITIEDAG